MGVAYKKDVSDLRESPALRVMARLRRKGAALRYHDPLVSALPTGWEGVAPAPLTEAEIRAADCVLILTDHSRIDYALIAAGGTLIVDTRNALRNNHRSHIEKL